MSPPAAAAAARAPRAPSHERSLAPPARPRRVSGPTRPVRRERGGASAAPGSRRRGLVETFAAALARVAEHRLLTRLIAGKAWIAVVAFALIGIVTLQLGLLRLNTSIGRALEREGTLQRENAALSIESSELAAGERVESRATQLGMELVPEGALRFLGSRGGADVGRTLGALATPVRVPEGGESTAASGSSGGSGESAAATAAGAGESGTTGAESTASGAAAGREAEGRESGRGEPAGARGSGGAPEAQGAGEASGTAGASETGSASAPSPAGEGGERSAVGGAGAGPAG